jgi:hypothetical protein
MIFVCSGLFAFGQALGNRISGDRRSRMTNARSIPVARGKHISKKMICTGEERDSKADQPESLAREMRAAEWKEIGYALQESRDQPCRRIDLLPFLVGGSLETRPLARCRERFRFLQMQETGRNGQSATWSRKADEIHTRCQIGSVGDGFEGRMVESGLVGSKIGRGQSEIPDLDVPFVIYKRG